MVFGGLTLCAVLLTGLFSACGKRADRLSAQTLQSDTTVKVSALDDQTPVLPLPVVPATLRTPQERAAYILAHFWDSLEFADTSLSHRSDFMEQSFVNFLSVFPYAEPSDAQASVTALMQRAQSDTGAYRLLVNLVEKYLYEPNSPMRQEDYLIWFLEDITRTPVLNMLEKRRPGMLLTAARKNRPEHAAADFGFLTREGRRQTLYNTPGERTLLIFYDPLCEHCSEILEELRNSPALSSALRKGTLSVLAIYADGKRAAWDSTANQLPATWTVGFDLSGNIRHGLYALPAMPSLYLLDQNKTVLLKDAPLSEILSHL